MEVSYRRDGNHSFMVLSGIESVDTSAYPFRMITANKLEHFLECRIHMMDQRPLFYFDITSRQSLAVYLEAQNPGYEELRGLLESLLKALRELGRYLLDGSGILLNPEFIYRDENRLQFLYLPGYRQEKERGFRELAEFLLPKMNHADKKAVILGYGMYRRAIDEELSEQMLQEILYLTEEASEEVKSEEPEDFSQEIEKDREREELLDSLFSEEEEEVKIPYLKIARNILESVSVGLLLLCIAAVKWFSLSVGWYLVITALLALLLAADAFLHRKIKAEQQEEKILSEEPAKPEELFEPEREEIKSTPLDDTSEETVILQMPTVEADARLVPVSPVTFPVLPLNGGMKLIGKMEQTSDLLIPAETISRIHARIQYLEGRWQLQDLNSRNGTFVNGRALEGEEWYSLEPGDEISFADIIYRFRQK